MNQASNPRIQSFPSSNTNQNIVQAYLDFMNGEITAAQYVSAYPAEARHAVRVPTRKPVPTIKAPKYDSPTNPVSVVGLYRLAV